MQKKIYETARHLPKVNNDARNGLLSSFVFLCLFWLFSLTDFTSTSYLHN